MCALNPNKKNDLSEGQLKTGYWVATHRKEIKLAYTALLGAVAAASVIIFFIYLLNWLTHIQQTEDILQSLASPIEIFDAIRRPEDIVIAKAIAVQRDEKSIDVVVHMQNPNDLWGAVNIEYEVFTGSTSAGKETTTLAPLQEKFLTKSSILHSGTKPPMVTVTVHDVQWKKIADSSSLPQDDWEFLNPSMRYIDSQTEALAFKTELSFTLRNKSVLGFREPQVVVLMQDAANNIQAIGSLYIEEISSLQRRDITFRWPKRLSGSLTPVIYVNVDKLTEERIIREL
ncbi:hypothetical protein ACFL2M_00420 [Patescibacteria group bacterium]